MISPSIDSIAGCFAYDPLSGALLRKSRPRDDFQNDRAFAAWKGTVGRGAGSVNADGYVCVNLTIDGKTRKFRAHRLIWAIMTGSWPDHEIDHINCDRADNRWVNLRVASHKENSANMTVFRKNKAGFKGVHISGKRFVAQIEVAGKKAYLGTYETPEEANAAYREAALEHHGAFARW